MACCVLLGCVGIPAAERPAQAADASTRADDAGEADAGRAPTFRPDLPGNVWVHLRDDLPVPAWETAIAYDPRTGDVVQHGGHIAFNYAQSGYTTHYNVEHDSIEEARAPVRPMRRCIVESAWLSGPQRVATVQGAASHGTMPQGIVRYFKLERADAVGPWLYDAVTQEWEHMRPAATVSWPQREHAAIAYDETSDAMFLIGNDGLVAYFPRLNRIVKYPLPSPLLHRMGYALAVDPDARKLVVFGGASRHWVYGNIDGDETDNCGVVSDEVCASYYRAYVKDDTWVLDLSQPPASDWVTNADAGVPSGWHQVEGAHPPRGLPMWNHNRLSFAWHPGSGQLLLLQNDISQAPLTDVRQWPLLDLWAFDAKLERWALVPTQNPPHLYGVTSLATKEDVLLVWGGGHQGADASQDTHAMGNTSLYLMRPHFDGPRLDAPSVDRVQAAAVGPEDNTVVFDADVGASYEVQRATSRPEVGPYQTVATVTAEHAQTTYVDHAPDAGFVGYRVRKVGTQRFSIPGFTEPPYPHQVVAHVESSKRVEVRWAPLAQSVKSLRVYRLGPEGRVKLAALDPTSRTYTDTSVDLSDGRVRAYGVAAVDFAGREGGLSPLAFSVDDAPRALDVHAEVHGADGGVDGGVFEVNWAPRSPGESLQLYYLDYHCNARSSIVAYMDAYTPVLGRVQGGHGVVHVPPLDPVLRNKAPLAEPGECGRTLRPGHYFYGRIVNALGQEGFFSDLMSPSDARFRAAAP